MKKSKVVKTKDFKNLYSEKQDKGQTGISSYNHELLKNSYNNKYSLFVGTPCTGLVRMEWAMARFGQVIPCNFGMKTAVSWMPSYAPMGYLVADAQNIIVKRFLEDNCTWLLLVEEDNVLPPDCFLRLNEYIRSEEIPVVSGLYYTKSRPAEPMVYRGRGNSFYTDWKVGDKVWVDAVPTGCILIHRSILQLLWNESPEYKAGDVLTRRVFYTPEVSWFDPEKGVNNSVGTSDMEFCSRLIMGKVFERAGWPKIGKMEYPFLIDTSLKIGHITQAGELFPSPSEWAYWSLDPKKRPSLINGNGSNDKKKEKTNARNGK